MAVVDALVEQKLGSPSLPLALVLPGGRRIGAADAAVTLRLNDLASLASIATGQVGRIGEDYVEGRIEFDGSMRDLMAVTWPPIGDDPTRRDPAPLAWWRPVAPAARSRARHRPPLDARQVRCHYVVSDDFFALWLDPRRLSRDGRSGARAARPREPPAARRPHAVGVERCARGAARPGVADDAGERRARLPPYLAGSAMCFEHGWLSLSQVLASRPSGDVADGPMRGAQSRYPFNRRYMYAGA